MPVSDKHKKGCTTYIWLGIIVSALLISCRKSEISLERTKTIHDNGEGTGTVTWTRNNYYLLDGLVFVNDGQVLTIEAGTVIRARTGQDINASALVVARGGKLIAEGTRAAPIIFTVEGDDLVGSVPLLARGLWGGVILLGNASLNNTAGEAFIEGIPLNEPRGVYGGHVDDDNSGILRYVSIRHGGTNIGEGNEINGLTLGAVGNKTIIDHVEVISNYDDGFEFFGGTVNCSYLVSAFCGDDAFDFDMGYRGMGQFYLAVQDPSSGDKLAEHDGGHDPIIGKPLSIPVISNATYIGRGNAATGEFIAFANNAGGKYFNSLFLYDKAGISIEYTSSRENSFTQFGLGKLRFAGNLFFEVANDDPDQILNLNPLDGSDVSLEEAQLDEYFASDGNRIKDPGILIDGLEIHPVPLNAIHDNLVTLPDPWFQSANYRGAFLDTDWTLDWTLFSQREFYRKK
jgi:hypothetical protein